MSSLYSVQKVLDKRTSKAGTQYLVKWKGFSVEESTWEPASHLVYVDDLVKQFQKERKTKGTVQEVKDVQKKGSSGMQVEEKKIAQKSQLVYEENHSSEEEEKKEPEKAEQPKKDEVKPETAKPDRAYMFYYEDTPTPEGYIKSEDQVEEEPRKQARSQKKETKKTKKSTKKEAKKTSQKHPPKKTKAMIAEQAPKKAPHLNGKRPHKQVDYAQEEEVEQREKQPTSSLAQIEENVRYRSRSVPRRQQDKEGPLTISKLRIEGMFKDAEGRYIFKVASGSLTCFMSREFFMEQNPDQLIRFYQSKIQFTRIPKLLQ